MNLAPALRSIAVLYWITMLVLVLGTPRYGRMLEARGAAPNSRNAWTVARYLLDRRYHAIGDARITFWSRLLLAGYILYFSLMAAFLFVLAIAFFVPVL